ncbi:sterol desaturase family protein [Sandaracinobacteroides saxicola]|uniref:Sterol desaturase family protein n=1 Tax=Sandaracinobacteroides saxicola TaxID=2759707 RepID=A0A7G5IFA1_9SPHN|nr:sterol desaturase family protein [Sandaracinobacteroides saxicola]QMW22043.1 sterol desaturase family protein [Sandaracinobacteroides saxicola]
MAPTLIATMLLMSLIVALRYLALSGLFAAITARVRPGLYRPALPAKAARMARQIRREIGWSLLSAVIYGAPAGLAVWAWQAKGLTLIYTDPMHHPLWWLPLSVLVYLLAHDAWFYWTHRAMHGSAKIFRTMHAVHHESRPPTAWAAMAFHPTEALSAAWLYPVMVFLVPIHVGALGVVLAIASFFAVTNHMGWEIFPRRWIDGWLGRHLISASHHHLHHGNYGANFGLYFRFWDRWMNTDAGISRELLR